MAKLRDLKGQRFGKLVVLERGVGYDKRKSTFWLCQCDCGNKTTVVSYSLREDGTQSCGCLSKKHFVDLTGQKFNNLTVIKYLGKDNCKNNMYLNQCDCGGTIQTQGSDVKTGKIKSCGCKKFSKQVTDARDKGNETLFTSLYASYKRPKRGYKFNIDFDTFKKMVQENCAYCGCEPSNVMKDRRSFGERMIRYNGIDRVDNDRDYDLDNIVTCCRSCNIAKHTYSLEEFEKQIINRYNMLMKKREGSGNG